MRVERERTNVSRAAVKCNFGSGNLHSIQTKWHRHPHYVNVKGSDVPSVTHIETAASEPSPDLSDSSNLDLRNVEGTGLGAGFLEHRALLQ